jgi:hypothetical protein
MLGSWNPECNFWELMREQLTMNSEKRHIYIYIYILICLFVDYYLFLKINKWTRPVLHSWNLQIPWQREERPSSKWQSHELHQFNVNYVTGVLKYLAFHYFGLLNYHIIKTTVFVLLSIYISNNFSMIKNRKILITGEKRQRRKRWTLTPEALSNEENLVQRWGWSVPIWW